MNKLEFLLSALYSLGQIALGLFLHPYQTMQSLVRDSVFVWMSLMPTFLMAVITLAWRLLIVPAVKLVFSCRESGFVGCDYLPFVSNWLIFFFFYWQLILIYLLFRFEKVFRG